MSDDTERELLARIQELENDQRAYAMCIGVDPDAEDFDGVTTAAIRLWQEYKTVAEDRDRALAAAKELRAALVPLVTGGEADDTAEAAELARWDDRLAVPIQYIDHATGLTIGDLRRAWRTLAATAWLEDR